MRGLAVELARHKVRCNSLLPGWTDTELLAGAKTHEKFVTATIQRTPVRRSATLHDFETVGAFLGDPSLVFHNGDSTVVDSVSDPLTIETIAFGGAASGRRVIFALTTYPAGGLVVTLLPKDTVTTNLTGQASVQVRLHAGSLPDSVVVTASMTRFAS